MTHHSLSGERIGFFTPIMDEGGSEYVMAAAIESAVRAGATVVCWSRPEAAIRRLTSGLHVANGIEHRDWLAPGVPRKPVDADEGPASDSQRSTSLGFRQKLVSLAPTALRRWRWFRSSARAFSREIRSAPVAVLVVHVAEVEAASVGGRWAGVPVINCYHRTPPPLVGSAVDRSQEWVARRSSSKAADWTIHVSKAARDQWCQAFGVPVQRTSVIYNGVASPPIINRQAKRRELGIRDDQFVFVLPARFESVKGHIDLIEAIACRRDELASTVVLLCGDGELRGECEDRVRSSGLASLIRFLGWRRDIPDLLQASDCLVLPSRAENLSLALVESLMVGIPAVATCVGGTPEVVRDGQTGWLVPPAAPQLLARAMVQAASNPKASKRMGAEGRDDVTKRFARDRMMQEYVATIRTVLRRQGTGGER